MNIQHLVPISPFSIIAVIALALLVVLTITYFLYVYIKEKQLLSTEEKTLTNYENILERANRQARNIIQHASARASRILSNTTSLKETVVKDTEENYEQNMKHMSEEELAIYRKTLLDTFSVSKKQLDTEIAKEFSKAKEDIETYKKEQLAHVDEKVQELVDKLGQQVLGKKLSREDHEKLIVEALESAKQEGLFTI